mgnify:FL=1
MDKNNRIEKKRKQEIEMLDCMIRIYCRGNHGTKEKLCEDCQALREYAVTRTQKCPFMETKTFCSNCRVHCYRPDMREKIRAVMRWAGPRMLLHHPVAAARHVIETKREKKKLEAAE